MGDALTAARTWLRECPLIDKNDRFNVNYLGDRAVEYALTLASETHKEDVCGYDIATYNMVFLARLPFGAHMGTNIASAAFKVEYEPCTFPVYIAPRNKNDHL